MFEHGDTEAVGAAFSPEVGAVGTAGTVVSVGKVDASLVNVSPAAVKDAPITTGLPESDNKDESTLITVVADPGRADGVQVAETGSATAMGGYVASMGVG